jgi:hypothetical protein
VRNDNVFFFGEGGIEELKAKLKSGGKLNFKNFKNKEYEQIRN